MRPVFRLPRVHPTEHHDVRDFPAPDLEPTLEGAQKPISIGPRIFDLQSSKQLTASSPRLRSEPVCSCSATFASGSGRRRPRFCFGLGSAVGRTSPSFHATRRPAKNSWIGTASVDTE